MQRKGAALPAGDHVQKQQQMDLEQGEADDSAGDVALLGNGPQTPIEYVVGLLSSIQSTLRSISATLFGACLRSRTVSVNGRAFNIVRKVGEGGFSFVYLVHDAKTGQPFAMKKMYCQSAEQKDAARHEVQIHIQFSRHANIMPLVEHSFVRLNDGTEEALLVFPYYSRGSLQDFINSRLSSEGPYYSEAECLRLAAGIAQGLLALHTSHPVPLAHRDLCPRNVMLGDDGRTPILIDLGSAAPARVQIASRMDALRLAETAAAHSSMPYRAAELWDPQTGSSVTEATDIWSLGATLYCLAFGYSPFESIRTEGGRLKLADPSHLKVLNPIAFPGPPLITSFSQPFLDLIKDMLRLNPQERPSVHQVLSRIRGLLGPANAGIS